MLPLLVATAAAGPALLDPAELPALEKNVGELDTLTAYTFDQAVDDVSGTFTAKGTIRWTNTGSTAVATLPLRLHPNAGAELGMQATPRVAIDTLSADRKATWDSPSPTRVEVVFADPIDPGERVVLDVAWHGRLDLIDARANDPLAQAMAQMGSIAAMPTGDYGLLARGDGLFVMATAYPMVAPPIRSPSGDPRTPAGGFDSAGTTRIGDVAYNAMARFDVRTVVAKDVAVVTNLADWAVEDRTTTRVVKSKGDAVRDLVIVGGRDLAQSSTRVGDVTVRSWYRPRDEAAGKRALDVAATSLASFEKRFGSYPYTELDVAEATLVGGAGGVEFCGLVLVAGMLYSDPAASQSQLAQLMKMWGALGGSLSGGLDPAATQAAEQAVAERIDRALEFTVAHEVAHQWFAGIVGNDSHRSPTLDEPLAQYLAGLAMEDRYGKDEAKVAMDEYVKLNYALWRALDGPDRIVRRDVATYHTNAEYAALVYGKAPYAWVELRGELGDDRLHAAIRAGVDAYRFDIASTDAFVAVVDAKAGGQVAPKMRRYLDETHGDEDLGLADPADYVLKLLLPEETYTQLDQSLTVLGLSRSEFAKMLFGGGIIADAPLGTTTIDPATALEGLGPR